jgi:uncharacterized repeat protein (TIGR03803 family)
MLTKPALRFRIVRISEDLMRTCHSKCPSLYILLVLFSILLCICSARAFDQEHVLYSFKGGLDGSTPTDRLISDAHGNLYGTTSGNNFDAGTVFELTPPVSSGAAWTETVLHNFPANNGDGWGPLAGLIFDKGGNLYGTTFYGGEFGCGIVFELTPPATTGGSWTEAVLHSFNCKDGSAGGGLVFRSNVLYGTTSSGGSGRGNVYALAPRTTGGSWRERVLHNFSGGSDGVLPEGAGDALTADKLGNYYGVTSFGGTFGPGTVFQMTPPTTQGGTWTESVLYSFGGYPGDGREPISALEFDGNGNLYGTTYQGGEFGRGTVFELTPPSRSDGGWIESVIYNFTGGTDGGWPWGSLIFDTTGNLYGTTIKGSVYELIPPATEGGTWTELTLHTFGSHNDGASPQAGLLMDRAGNLYGTTSFGGATNNGTVFAIRR